MTNIKEVDPSRDNLIGWSAADDAYHAFGCRYVLPQVGRYVQVAGDVAERLRWSFLGLDRTNGTRSLMMGEYTTSEEAPGRLVWWRLDERTGRLALHLAGRSARRSRERVALREFTGTGVGGSHQRFSSTYMACDFVGDRELVLAGDIRRS
jgi:hypothetical protein